MVRRVWKKHMEAIMNEENPWDEMVNVVLDVLSEDGRKGALYELLYADDLVLMAETMEELEA